MGDQQAASFEGAGDLRRQARAAACDVARDLEDPAVAGPYFGLDGNAAIALLHGYLARAFPGDGHEARMAAHLDRAIDGLASTAMAPSLFGGFTGIAWTVAHLDPTAGDDLFSEIDDALMSVLAGPRAGDPDIVSGAAGIGIYALERLPATAPLLAAVVRALAAGARVQDGTTHWWRGPDLLPAHQRADHPDGHADAGVAHGVAGVLGVLAGAWRAGVEADVAAPLLAGAARWLLGLVRTDDASSRLPYWTGPGIAWEPARSAWCYGDPGVAAALLATGDARWRGAALDLGRAVASRSPERTGAEDAGLCHGYASLAHVLGRLAAAAPDEPALAGGRDRWLATTLAARRPGTGFGGYAIHQRRLDGGFDDESLVGLLGAAGVGLTLLGLGTDVEPAWDRVLGASLPPPP